jgi:hypothetical protein
VFYGSTTQALSTRIGAHKSAFRSWKQECGNAPTSFPTQGLSKRTGAENNDFKSWRNGSGKFSSSFHILKYDDTAIFLVEHFPCSSREELKARERHHIDNNICVNKDSPGKTPKVSMKQRDPLRKTAMEMVAQTIEGDKNRKMFKASEHIDVNFLVDLLTKEKRCCYTDCNLLLQTDHIGPDRAALERVDTTVGFRKWNTRLACFKCAMHQRDYSKEATRSQCSATELADLDSDPI